MADTPNYEINYEDDRFKQVEADKDKALADLDNTYGGVINGVDKYYQDMKDATTEWEDKQLQIQQENTDFAIEKIEQEKQKAHQSYTKEQSGAYVDWQKQSNQYGVNAEKMASAGLNNSGFSESSQVSMYNTYQNRVATARESYNNAVINYNNAIKDAQLQNNAALAEIAYQALEKRLQLALEGFQYKNQLVLEQANKKMEVDNMYYNRWQNVLNQMNTDNALKEQIRQFNEGQKFTAEQNELNRNFQAEQDRINREFDAAQAELNRKHDKDMLNAKTEKEKELLKIQHENDMKKLAQQKANEIAILEKEYQLEQQAYKAKITGTSFGAAVSKAVTSTASKIAQTGSNIVKKSVSNAIKSSSSSANSSSSSQKIDTDNILALGYGPISSKRLNQLVEEGKVIEYEENGVLKFKNRPTYKNFSAK